jgi:hypothetical protein
MQVGEPPRSRSRLRVRLVTVILLSFLGIVSSGCTAERAPTAVRPEPNPFPPAPLIDPRAAPPPTLSGLAAQAGPLRFDHVPPEAGLSQSVVMDMIQDDLGFLWLATQDGLNRYDGNEFRIFKAGPDQPEGLTGNFLSSLDKAPTGEIWIGGNDNGLTSYDPRNGRFTAYLHDPDDPQSLSENVILSLDVALMVLARAR